MSQPLPLIWRSSAPAAIAACLLALSNVTAADDSVGAVDFNRDVRPILNQHCVSCHGGVKQAADLSFVYADQALTVIEPGSPDDSYMFERVLAEGEERMPPLEHGRGLNEKEIATLRDWITQGAVWADHWAFVQPQRHTPPATDGWARQSVDGFVHEKLQEAGLSPAEPASPDRWLRRVSLELTGLPPTPQRREAFLAEVARDGEVAYEAEVDRLLADPHFGERWSSVWLDAVRYADSRGLGQDGRRTIWKYRDWVIKALNEDMPYDRFTIRQLAGDLLPEPTIDDLVATAASRLTQTNEEGGTDDEMFRVEAVMDRVNTTWQVWQGLSFGCTQCHSHPYDPIRHEEYYQYLSFFNNTADTDLTEDLPLVAAPVDDRAAAVAVDLDRRIDELKVQLWREGDAMLQDQARWRPVTAMTASTDNATKVEVVQADGQAEYQTRGTVAKETTVTLEAELPQDIERLTAFKFTGLPENLEQALKDSEWGFVLSHVTAKLVRGDGTEQPLTITLVQGDEPHPLSDPMASLDAKDELGFGAYTRINHPRSAAFVFDEVVPLAKGDKLHVSLQQRVTALGAFPLVAKRGRVAVSGDADWTQWLHGEQRMAAESQLADLQTQRKAIPSVLIPVMGERPERFARPTLIFDRGNYLIKTDLVESNTPEFLPREEPADGQPLDRLDLAQWMVDAENPLTARVAVNRVWGQLFGTGLVETQEDFGSSGDPPSHPELLDDLAVRFRDDMRWSVKSLLRELVLSSAYRQSSKVTPEKLAADPANRLISRGPRNRLPAETVRDQALSIAGLLDRRLGGPPVHPPLPEGVWDPFLASDRWKTPGENDGDRYRRTVYTYIKRSIPYPVSSTFDAPSREFCAVRRLPSNTPLQALMTLNDATFVEAADALASRMASHSDDLRDQLQRGFVLATSREPSDAELDALRDLAQQAAAEQGADTADGLRTAASVLLNLDEVLSK